MGVRDGIGHLNGDLDGSPDIHLPSCRLCAERLALLKLERQIDATIMFADVEKSRDVGMGQRAEPSRPFDQPLTVHGEVRWQEPDSDCASELGVSRTIQV